MGFYRGPGIVTRGLFSAYDFSSVRSYPYQASPGGTDPLLKDLVNGHDMTVEGSPTFLINNTAYGYMTFSDNGAQTTEYCICNPYPLPTSEITIEVWHRMVNSGNTQGLVSYAVSSNNNECLMFWNGSSWGFYGPSSDVSTGISTSNGEWVQLVRTDVRSSGTIKGYVNGELEYTGTLAAGTDFEAGGSLVFAQEQDSVGGGFDSGQCFQGDLGFVRIYDRALEANEIKQNFLSQKSRFGL